ncbi:phage shock protein operon transcriptional activator [Thorsellia kenyensis]|uniref:Phage shock protein operon transcriptional activator n=1 Tax=Thorsellia kenyensis TaxID=1549888 RepID=A0ABV6C774_9GAMM
MEKTEQLIGEDNQFIAILEQASRLAKINKPVLILGERGTGKELIAQRLHFLSNRWSAPLITLNCAALNEQLLDSELFGHEVGAFTGAQKRHKGRFERADKGSLFLDEIGNAPKIVQEKLLRVIEYGELERVGGSQELKVDVRLICATNEDLSLASKAGTFRADLLDRLAFDVINLPPLRERGKDILLLAQHFAVCICRELGWTHFPGFSDHAVAQLYEHKWPGNIRELKNAVERSIFRTDENKAPIEELIINPFKTQKNTQLATQSSSCVPSKEAQKDQGVNRFKMPDLPIDFKQASQEFQVSLINSALAQSLYHQKKAARLLGLTYDQFRSLIKKYADFITLAKN